MLVSDDAHSENPFGIRKLQEKNRHNSRKSTTEMGESCAARGNYLDAITETRSTADMGTS